MNQLTTNNSMSKLAMGAVALLLFFLLIPSLAFAADDPTYSVKVDKGYLALRTAPAYDESNEIGELYTGDLVTVQDSSSNKTYWKVYSPKYKKSGWVNKDYLTSTNSAKKGDYQVKVDKNYLALRTAPAYDASNEIGKLFTGDMVTLISEYNDQYWWVFSPKYNKYGYVNKDFLTTPSSSYGDYTVKVDKNYLALRTAPSYDESNEIGKLYTGDVVTVMNKPNGQYWWVYSPKYNRQGYVNKDYLVAK